MKCHDVLQSTLSLLHVMLRELIKDETLTEGAKTQSELLPTVSRSWRARHVDNGIEFIY